VDQAAIEAFYAAMDIEGRRASTLATAIQINRPVNLIKCLRALETCDGVVREVSDQEILDAKAQVGSGGFGCEPASAAAVAGARLLRQEGTIAPGDRVVCILTGHQLKDPNATVAYHAGEDGASGKTFARHSVHEARLANRPVVVENSLDRIMEVLRAIG
jgi:threonine synthase